ncbi:MAG: outer membrane protein assembly factor BamB family protein [Solirubrobacteraceae bacterium]
MFPRPRGRMRWVALGAVVLLAVVGAAAAIVLTSQPGDVSNPGVEFTAPSATATEPTPTKAAKNPTDDGFSWPDYGYTKQRTRWLPLRTSLRPPWVKEWAVTGSSLIEFPPVICKRSLYMEKNNGALYKISRLTGKVKWKLKLGDLAASSPACAYGKVFAVVLARGKGIDAGRVVALNANSGKEIWSRNLPSRAESSPLIDKGRVYFGTENGTVYALRARDGAVRWTYHAGGAVKGALALDGGRLFFGDYGGHVQAIRQRDGSRIWSTSSAGSAFGLQAGRFYSTAAVAYGRVYIGSLDGFMYSFGASNGKLAWRHKTGGYVYSSPAVGNPPGAGPTVYVGSYDGKLYAFDAQSGRVRWTHGAGGKISGAPQIIGDLVFYSVISTKSSAAVGASTGKEVWRTHRGAFNPVISDGRRLYFLGYSSLFMLAGPRQARIDEHARRGLPPPKLTPAERRAARAAAKRARKRAVGRRVARHRRFIALRVAARRAAVHRTAALRRRGRKICFRSGGKSVCRVPKPLVCVTDRKTGHVDCRPRR